MDEKSQTLVPLRHSTAHIMASAVLELFPEDEHLRQQIMRDILKYNEEDLKATWAVFQWLKGKNNT